MNVGKGKTAQNYYAMKTMGEAMCFLWIVRAT